MFCSLTFSGVTLSQQNQAPAPSITIIKIPF